MNIRASLRNNVFVRRLYYGLRLDVVRDRKYIMKGLEEAINTFLTPEERENPQTVAAVVKDIRRNYWRTQATPEEYFLYGFRGQPWSYRKEFLTDAFLHRALQMGRGKFVSNESELMDKAAFCKRMEQYMNRRFVEVKSESDYEAYLKMTLEVKDLFFKPNFNCKGAGIFAAHIESADEARRHFDLMMKEGGVWLVEQKIVQCREMASWNATSVNTIRYYSFLDNEGNYNTYSAIIRVGRNGNVVDNTGSGGMFAAVDVETGAVYSDALDSKGMTFKIHPDTGIEFKNWEVPRWRELSELVKKIHTEKLQNHHYIGWDWALTNSGWTLIEANWGQPGVQACDKIGRKKVFLRNIGKLK